MPKILDRLVSQLVKNGLSKSEAYAIAISKLRKAGDLKKGSTEATKKGVTRGEMSPSERAKDRAAKKSGGKPSDYNYNKKNNSAVKGKVSKNVKKRA
jgi:hypothetical protein